MSRRLHSCGHLRVLGTTSLIVAVSRSLVDTALGGVKAPLGQGVRGEQDGAQHVLSSPRCREVFQPRADEGHHVFQERNLLVVAEPERELSVGNKVFQRVRVVTFEVGMKLR